MGGLNVNQVMRGLQQNIAHNNPPQVQPPPQQGGGGGGGQALQNAGAAQAGAPQVPNVHLNRLAKVGAGALLALRALGALATLGISEGIVRGVRTAVRNSGTERTTNMQVNINLPQPLGGAVALDGRYLPKRIPTGGQAQLQIDIQGKVNNGHALLDQINHGNAPVPCSLSDMADIMYFLQAVAVSRGEHFTEGAFSIDDPGGRIRAFLDTCPQAYQRESSHVGHYQSAQDGRHRGIDVHGRSGDVQTSLPGNKKTLLYGSLQASQGRNLPSDRLFLKMESYGAYLTHPKGGGDAHGPQRYANFRDASAMIGHTFSFLETRGQGSAAGSRKERIPDTVKAAYQEIIDAAPPHLKAQFENNGPLTTSGGIKTMIANAGGPPSVPTGIALLDQKLAAFDVLMQGYDHLADRIGNEVILSAQEMGV